MKMKHKNKNVGFCEASALFPTSPASFLKMMFVSFLSPDCCFHFHFTPLSIPLGSISNHPMSPSSLPSSLSRTSPVIFPIPSFFCPFRPSPSTVLLFLFDLSLAALLPKLCSENPLPATITLCFFAKQEVLPDRKRVTTRSYLPITPADTDSGRNFTCVASNPAVPMGKRATVALNVHRMLDLLSVIVQSCSGDWGQTVSV